MIWDVPPTIYDHSFSGTLIELRWTAEQIDWACDPGALACAYTNVGGDSQVCIINIPVVGPGGIAPRTYAIMRRHEIAHCNGWRHAHDGR